MERTEHVPLERIRPGDEVWIDGALYRVRESLAGLRGGWFLAFDDVAPFALGLRSAHIERRVAP
jgi:hypothetical protein